MPRDWEQTFKAWTAPSSDTEDQKRDHALQMILDAIRANAELSLHEVQVFPQGSYRNNTNVRVESDVDICVCARDTFFYNFDLAQGFTRADVGFADATYSYALFKN